VQIARAQGRCASLADPSALEFVTLDRVLAEAADKDELGYIGQT